MDTIKLRRVINQGIINTATHKAVTGDPHAEIHIRYGNIDEYCEKIKAQALLGIPDLHIDRCSYTYIRCSGCAYANTIRKEFRTLINFVPRGHGKLGLVYTCSTCNGTTSELVDIIPNRAKKVPTLRCNINCN